MGINPRWSVEFRSRQPQATAEDLRASPLWFEPDAITTAVIAKLKAWLSALPRQVKARHWLGRDPAPGPAGVGALHRYPFGGIWSLQDAMVSSRLLWHSLISPYINLGLRSRG